MNRREAIAALIGLPAVASIKVAVVHPDDVIVIEADEYLSERESANIERVMTQVWPRRKVVVLGRGMHLQIARASPSGAIDRVGTTCDRPGVGSKV